MPNYSFNSIVLLLVSVTSGPLGLWMDGIEMVGVEMGSVSDGCCNIREKGEGGVKPLEDFIFEQSSSHQPANT